MRASARPWPPPFGPASEPRRTPMCEICERTEAEKGKCSTQRLIEALSSLKGELADGFASVAIAVREAKESNEGFSTDLRSAVDDLSYTITDLSGEVRDLDQTISGVPK